MSWTWIEDATAASATSGTTLTPTFPTGGAIGDQVLVGYTCPTAGNSVVSSISMTGVSGWARQDNHTAVAQRMEIWVGTITGTPGTVATVTLTPTINGGQTARAFGSIFRPTGTVSVGIQGVGTSANASTRTTETLSPTASKSALLFAFQRGAGTFTSGPTGGWTGTNAGSTNTQPAYLIVPSTSGTYSTSWTYTTAQAYETTAIVLYETPTGVKFKPWFAH